MAEGLTLTLKGRQRCDPPVMHTASTIQVRQPLYRDALDRWRQYRHHLAPLINELSGGGSTDVNSVQRDRGERAYTVADHSCHEGFAAAAHGSHWHLTDVANARAATLAENSIAHRSDQTVRRYQGSVP